MPDAEASALALVEVESVLDRLRSDDWGSALVIDSPPGAGKSTLVVQAVAALIPGDPGPIPVVAQTNNQADDLTRRLAHAGIRVGRLHKADYATPTAVLSAGKVAVSTRWMDLIGCQAIVSTAKKWQWCNNRRSGPPPHFALGLIDEAYQMRSDALYGIANLFDRAVAVGDPGQLDPFTTVDDARWAGQPLGPLATAAGVLLRSHPQIPARLPVSFRLPPSAAGVLAEAFYDQPFAAGTLPGEREMELRPVDVGGLADRALDLAAETGWAFVELDRRFTARVDQEIVATIVDIVVRLFDRDPQTRCEEAPDGRALTGTRVAVATAHRDQADAVRTRLREIAVAQGNVDLATIAVDTANRHQGREFDLLIAWHPLAGRRDASEFHLESGRLCVMISRHRHACVVVGRAGTAELLDAHPLAAPVYLDLPAKLPDGWEANQAVLEHLTTYRVA